MKYDLIIFDFDGTLADSESILVGLVNRTLIDRGHAPADPRFVAGCIGLPLAEVFRRSAPQLTAEENVAACHAYRVRANSPDVIAEFALFDGVEALLSDLSRGPAQLAIGTSKSRVTTLRILDHLGITERFDIVLGGDSVERGKPDPEMVRRACEHAACAPERALMVGDTTFDLEMGRAAGADTCAVSYGMQDLTRLRELCPTHVIDRPGELLEKIR